MLAIGGGKGTYSTGIEMTSLGKPVLPMDLRLGSITNDGEGAVALHRELTSNPRSFFPKTHADVINRIGLIGLNRGINDVGAVARTAAEVLEREFSTETQRYWRTRVKKRVIDVWQYTKTLPVLASVIKIVESIVRTLS